MAAAVLTPLSNLTLDGGIMPPSPVSQNNSRHGRSRHGGSVAKKTRGRGYSTVDDRETIVNKAITFVLKRTISEDDEQEEGDEKLVADEEGWVEVEDLLKHSHISPLQLEFSELQTLSTSAKSKYILKADSPTSSSTDPADFYLRLKPSNSARPDSPTSSKASDATPLTADTPDLPSLIVYETSYANYPLILASGGIKRAGGQAQLVFSGIQVLEDGTEVRPQGDSDVYIYLDLKSVLASNEKISWAKTENGNIVTAGDSVGTVPKSLWKKVVARRADIGVLFQDGEIKKEIPIGLRGKGVKPGKKGVGKGKGRGFKDLKKSEGEESASE